MSTLKIGDKVKLTETGYQFQHNINEKIRGFQVPGETGLRQKDVEWMLCEFLAVQGTGTIIKFNMEGDPYVKWKWRNAGMYFYHGFHYDIDDVRPLTLLEKLCSYFK